MKKKIFILFILLFMFAGCTSSEEKEKKKKNEENAKTIVIDYFKNKYDFEPQILSSEAIMAKSGSALAINSPYTDDVLLRLKKDNKFFISIVNAASENIDGYDNYQKELIENDFIKKISSLVTGKIIYSELYYGYSSDDCIDREGYVKEYYDGKNIDSVMFNTDFEISYLGSGNIDTSKLEKLFNSNIYSNNNSYIYIFSNLNDYNELNGNRSFKYANPLYIKEYYELSNKDDVIVNKHISYHKKLDNITLARFDENMTNITFKNVSDYSFKDVDMDKYKLLTNIYSIEDLSSKNDIVIGIPYSIANASKFNDFDIVSIVSCDDKVSIDGTNHPTKTNFILYKKPDCKDYKFTLAIKK